MALISGRNTVETLGTNIVLPVKAGVVIYEGALVAIDGGYAIPAKKATGLIAAGRAEKHADNSSGENGAIMVHVKRGIFKYDNNSENPIGVEHVFKDCYMLDDETVTALSTGASKAGKVLSLDGDEVIVEIK